MTTYVVKLIELFTSNVGILLDLQTFTMFLLREKQKQWGMNIFKHLLWVGFSVVSLNNLTNLILGKPQ